MTTEIDFDLEGLPGLLLPPVLKKVPLMIVLTVTFFIATILTFYSQQWLAQLLPSGLLLLAEIILIPLALYLSLFIASLLLMPLAPIFDKKKHYAKVDFIGLKARVHSSTLNKEWGEVMVEHQRNEYLLDAKLDGTDSLSYGEEVIIVDQDLTSKQYVVTAINL